MYVMTSTSSFKNPNSNAFKQPSSILALRGMGQPSKKTSQNCFVSLLKRIHSEGKEFASKFVLSSVDPFLDLVYMKPNKMSKKYLPCQNGGKSSMCIKSP